LGGDARELSWRQKKEAILEPRVFPFRVTRVTLRRGRREKDLAKNGLAKKDLATAEVSGGTGHKEIKGGGEATNRDGKEKYRKMMVPVETGSSSVRGGRGRKGSADLTERGSQSK